MSTIPGAYFREQYRLYGDPWNFANSEYDHAKYRATIDALPRAQYRNALEIACSIGVFTEMLAPRCAALLAIDAAENAVEQAAARCAHLPHVRFAAMELPHRYPEGTFDLVTFCEMGFYLDAADLGIARERIVASLEPEATLVLVHWTPPVRGHAQTADEVHELFLADPRLRAGLAQRAPTYRLDVFARR